MLTLQVSTIISLTCPKIRVPIVIQTMIYLYHFMENQLDIVALTEMWLSSEDSKNKHVIDQFIIHLAHLVGEGVEWVYW